LNRFGLAFFALLLLCGVGAIVFLLAREGDGDPQDGSRAVARPVDARGSAVRPRGDTALEAAQAGPAVGLGVEPEGAPRDVATVAVPAGLAKNTRQTLSGNVVAAGRPLAGAQVLYATRDGQALGEDVTDGRGAFALQAPFPLEDGRILVRARGFAPLQTGPHGIRAGERRFVGNMMLTRGAMLAGKITDRTGVALEGATIELAQEQQGTPNLHVQIARTDHAGMFRFPDAPVGQVTLAARAPGFGGERREMLHQSEDDRTTIALGPETVLVVRVRDDRGAPVAGAEVNLRPHSPQSPVATGTTDAQGIARVGGLGSETWEVHVDAKGYRAAVRDGATAPGEVEIELSGWPAIRGRVVLPSGKPAPAGTTVKPLSANARGDYADGGLAEAVAVAPDGAFEIRDLRPGLYVVQASAPGWAPTRSKEQRLTLGRDSEGVTIQLAAGGSLELVVRGPVVGSTAPGEAERVLAGVACELWTQAPPPSELWRSESAPTTATLRPAHATTTDSAGRARFEHVAEGRYWCLARRTGLLPGVSGPIYVGGSGVTQTGLVLAEGGRLQGTLVGVPEGAEDPLVNLFGQDGVTQNTPVLVPANADGTWTSPLLPPGRYRITARLMAGTPPTPRTASAEHTLARGEVAQIRLELR
jgi:hypothetical protein